MDSRDKLSTISSYFTDIIYNKIWSNLTDKSDYQEYLRSIDFYFGNVTEGHFETTLNNLLEFYCKCTKKSITVNLYVKDLIISILNKEMSLENCWKQMHQLLVHFCILIRKGMTADVIKKVLEERSPENANHVYLMCRALLKQSCVNLVNIPEDEVVSNQLVEIEKLTLENLKLDKKIQDLKIQLAELESREKQLEMEKKSYLEVIELMNKQISLLRNKKIPEKRTLTKENIAKHEIISLPLGESEQDPESESSEASSESSD